MIPKIIHYCWFGGKDKPTSAKKYIAGWKKHCPDYTVIEWTEETFPITSCPQYIRDAYAAKKYAFVSDYVRLKVLYDQGGFYLDTDVELLKPLDPFLNEHAIIGFENNEFVNSGQMLAAMAGHPILKEMMDRYNHESFYQPDGSMYLLGCPHVNTDALSAHGLQKNGLEQTVADVHVFPADYFNPLDSATGALHKTKNTVSIHWYSMSWISPIKRIRVRILRVMRRVLTHIKVKR